VMLQHAQMSNLDDKLEHPFKGITTKREVKMVTCYLMEY